MDKWDDQSDIVEFYSKRIIDEIIATGKSDKLSEILSEHFDKDDIREIYKDEFEIIDAGE